MRILSQLLPTVLKSAVQSANTVVFIPNSFDFIRVHNYFKKNARVTFTVLSECVAIFLHPDIIMTLNN